MPLRRRPRRPVGAGALVLAVLACTAPVELLAASPASALLGAKPQPTLNLTSPPASGSGPAVLSTPTPTFAGTVVPGDQAGSGVIEPVKVVITSSAGHPGATVVLPASRPASGNAWTFSGSPVLPLTYNGVYQATVTATETDRGLLGNSTTGTVTTNVSFAEDVAPTAPQGVTAVLTSASPSTPAVTVTWSPNPEPDILGYGVLRSQGLGPLQQIGTTTTATSYVDTTARPGVSYTYAVVAVRAGDGAGQSLLSPATSAGLVSVPRLPPGTTRRTTHPGTTTTTLAPAAGGSLVSQIKSDLAKSGVTQAGASAGSGASGSSTASTGSTTTTSSAATGAPTQGGYSEVLPYGRSANPSVTGAGKASASGPLREPGASGSGNARARMLATIALGMIFLVVATLVIRLVRRAGRRQP